MILALETSSLVCGASLHDADGCVAELYIQEPRVHAEKLVGLVARLFEELVIRPDKLSAVAVSAGPGSFTGLRIGMSFAKGLVFPHSIPLAGVNTMKAFMSAGADHVKQNDHPVWVIRSHRNFVYTAEWKPKIDAIDIRYGQIADIRSWYPKCGHIICNAQLEGIHDMRLTEKAILPSAIGDYYLKYMNNSAVTDYDSLVLEYGMDYKPKEWKTGDTP